MIDRTMFESHTVSEQGTSLGPENTPPRAVATQNCPPAVLDSLLKNTDDTIMLVDADGLIHFVNRVSAGLAPDKLLGTSLFSLVPPASHERCRAALRNACEFGQADQYEQRWNDEIWRSVRVAPLSDQSPAMALVIATDIDQRKRAEDSLRESEERFRQLAENVREVFWLMDWNEQRVLYVTNAYQKIWGQPARQLYESAASWISAVHADDRARVERAFLAAVESGNFHAEYRVLRPDGSIRWIRDQGYPLRDADGKVCRMAGIAEDVTEQRAIEGNLRAERKLLKRLLDLQEKERGLLAYEIHDGFIQDLVGAKMLLESLRPGLPADQPALLARMDAIEVSLRKAIGEGRRMISNLRPLVIDDSGILAAIEYLINERQSPTSPEMSFRYDVAFVRLPPLLEGALFRIVQESLTNACRHSKATRVDIEMIQQDERVRLTVRDNGIGFDRAAVPEDRFGLRGLVERARLFGGRSQIHSTPGAGTEVWVDLPINKSAISQ
jgi:PAS domain S-box-containing protein